MSEDFSNRLILVVDDEPRMVKFVQTNLEMDGFRVVSASNGLEALDKVRRELPDLVVMDVMMLRKIPMTTVIVAPTLWICVLTVVTVITGGIMAHG